MTTAARLDAGAAMATASIATKSQNPSQHLSKQISSWEGQDAYSEDPSSECTGSTTAIAMPALSPKVTLNDGYITLLMFQNDELTRRVDAIETTLSKHMHGLGANGLGNTSEADGHDGTLSVAMQLDSKLSVAMQDFVAFRRQLELQLKQTVQQQDMKMQKLVDAVQGLTALVDNRAINACDMNPLTDTDETKETQKFADAMQGLNALVNQINGVANKASNPVPLTDAFGPKEARADYANDDVCISATHLDGANDVLPNAPGFYNASQERQERTIDECEARLLEVYGRLGNQMPFPDRTLNIEQTPRFHGEVPMRDGRPSTSQLPIWKPPRIHSSAQCEAEKLDRLLAESETTFGQIQRLARVGDQATLQAISAPTPSPCPPFATRTRSPRSPTRPARISHAGSLSEFTGKDLEEARGQTINTVYTPIRRMQSCAVPCSPAGMIPKAITPVQHVSLSVPSVNEVTRRSSAGSVQLPIRR